MFKPWISIPIDNVKVSVDYDFGDIRIMFKDSDTIDTVLEQLTNLKPLIEEIEARKLVIREVNPKVREAVEANGGHCPCVIWQTEDTKCPCKEFRDMNKPGLCTCGRYEKVLEEET